MEEGKVKKIVREGYAKIAKEGFSCCCPENSQKMGYTEEELKSVPGGAGLSLGCGNPVALASLEEGETVLDLGSGGGLDCFIAAKKVGENGKVIGVDMTPEMLDKARENSRKGNYRNVEFRLGEIENLPVADETVDVIVSNCVINLSANKKRVFEEAFRVLKPGGRLMISDIVLLEKLPKAIKENERAYVGCLAGAIMKDDYMTLIKETGFQEVTTVEETHFPIEGIVIEAKGKRLKSPKMPMKTMKDIANSIVSIKVCGKKPR